MPSPRCVIANVTVEAVDLISPTFARITFGGPELADLGTDGPVYDQRIKLIFPPASGPLPRLQATNDWYDQWLRIPESERGAMRTYSIRDVHGEGTDRRLVVDFVLHLEPGATGPASSWASGAAPGDQVIVIGPRRGVGWGGIEFAPGEASRILLAGDETAVPAMTRILADLPATTVGHAFLEVPHAYDVLSLRAPDGFAVHWLPRGDAAVGSQLIPALLALLESVTAPPVVDDGGEDTVWETPSYSGSGEELTTRDGITGLYAWLAGESGMVTTLRRCLVNDAGVARGQVAFMGYWRAGVAMRG